jgi:TolB protein
MKLSVFFFAVLAASHVAAGVSFSKEQDKAPAQKAADAMQKVMPFGDLSGVNLRVEGASFRKFSLYFPDAEQKSASALGKKFFNDIRQVIDRDLAVVGAFNQVKLTSAQAATEALVKQKGAEGISKLSLSLVNDVVKAKIEHKNLITGKTSTKNFEAKIAGIRRLSHQLAQSIYEEFVGPEDIFMLQIAAVRRERSGESHVVLVDIDGKNETVVADGKWLKSSPSFSPDGKSLLFAVNTPDGQGIVEQNIGSKQFQFRLKKPGLNIDPRVLPDNSGMLVTLSFENNANIYRTTRMGTIVGPITNGLGLNLSPAVSRDGKEIAFVSDRSGTPQIYVQSLADPAKKTAVRVTFKGTYNQTPEFSPDGTMIAFTGRDEKRIFDIFLLERKTERISRVTQNQGRNQEPFFSPSGRFVIFTSERDGKVKPDIFIASLNGDHQFRLTDANSDQKTLGYFSPTIKPKP